MFICSCQGADALLSDLGYLKLGMNVQKCPALKGRTFGELPGFFPNATVYGLMQHATHKCLLLPPHDTVLSPQVCASLSVVTAVLMVIPVGLELC